MMMKGSRIQSNPVCPMGQLSAQTIHRVRLNRGVTETVPEPLAQTIRTTLIAYNLYHSASMCIGTFVSRPTAGFEFPHGCCKLRLGQITGTKFF